MSEPNSVMDSHFQLGMNAISLLSPLTGIGQYTYNLILELQKTLTRAPLLFYGLNWSNELRSTPLPRINLIKKAAKKFIPRPHVLSYFLQKRRFLAGIKHKQPTLYHEPNYVTYPFTGPTVITIHDLSHVRYPETHPIERVRHLNRHMTRSINHARIILVDSDFVKREVIDYFGVPANKIVVATLGVAAHFSPATSETCRLSLQKYHLQYGKYILSVSTLEPRKNLASILQAYELLPNYIRQQYPLVIVGMQGWHTHDLMQKFDKLIQKQQVILTGFVSEQDLPFLYSGATVFLYPSLYEGFGLPPLEAMACGVPVIASNSSSFPEVVGDAGILVGALDVADWAHQIQLLIEDENLKKHYKQLGPERAKIFSWEQCARQTLQAYQLAMQ